jgi:uncharacterized membrane protein YgcG
MTFAQAVPPEAGVSSCVWCVVSSTAMLLVGLFAAGEQCSAAGALGMLYYFILAHQPDFDVVWVRGTVAEKVEEEGEEGSDKDDDDDGGGGGGGGGRADGGGAADYDVKGKGGSRW